MERISSPKCTNYATCLHSSVSGSNAMFECEETDPSGRFIRYNEVLGRGAFKTVYPEDQFAIYVVSWEQIGYDRACVLFNLCHRYKAFDRIDGLEVAWNQIRFQEVMHTSEDLQRLLCEVHLLKRLKHRNIIKFYHSWIDITRRNINLITEIFTSGNLRQYRKKHRHVNISAVKKWCRQILQGLLYLHSHDPPIIHRDLKCENIFINGNDGEVKIGDLGLAAILQYPSSGHSVVGTPEFMAPELYEEEYTELADIYSFGMCLLEMVTCEYPYSECTNAVQIYKKVALGQKPAALSKVRDLKLREFIEKCLTLAPERLSARELLMDPFLCCGYQDFVGRMKYTAEHADFVSQTHGFKIRGKQGKNNTIHLCLRITNLEGEVRNIHFPFDLEVDTALDVAREMIIELDLMGHNVSRIAEMIDAAILLVVPEWRQAAAIDDPGIEGVDPHIETMHDDCFLSNSSSMMSLESTSGNESQHGSSAWNSSLSAGVSVINTMHGRFKESMHQMSGWSDGEDLSCTGMCSSMELENAIDVFGFQCSNVLEERGSHTAILRHKLSLNQGTQAATSDTRSGLFRCGSEDDENALAIRELKGLLLQYKHELVDLQQKHEAALLPWTKKMAEDMHATRLLK